MSCKHFIENYTDGPNITFTTVVILIEGLKRHIDRRSNIIVGRFFDVSIPDSKSKISDFNFAFIEEDVGRFQVPMYNSESVDSSIAIDDLFKYLECLLFWYASTRLNDFAKITSIAKLGNYAGVGVCGDNFMHFYHVLEVA